jgi:hypothetical protein
VTTDDAHAWVEAHIAGMGWLAFDPTPGRGLPQSEDAEFEQPAATPTPEPAPPEEGQPTPEPTPVIDPSGADGGPDEGGLDLPILQILLAAVVVGGVPGLKAVRRSRRRSEGVLGAYDELLDRAADLGLRPRRAETPWEFWHRMGGDDATGAVVTATVRALYSPEPSTSADADRAWDGLKEALGALRERVPAWRRLAGLYDPRTLLPAGGLRLPRRRVATAES